MGYENLLGAGGVNLGFPGLSGANGINSNINGQNWQGILAGNQQAGMPGFSNPLANITGQQGPMLSGMQALWQMISVLMQKVDALMKSGPQSASAAQAAEAQGNTQANAGGDAAALPGGIGGSASSCPDGSCTRNNAGSGGGSQVARGRGSGRSGCGSSCGRGTSCNGCNQGGNYSQGPGGLGAIRPVRDPNLNARLERTKQLLATDPEGKRLLAMAAERGVKIQVGHLPSNLLGQFNPNTNTITISANNPDSVGTLAHELVHANTKEDGTSQTEEAAANVVGNQIESRLRGRAPRDPRTIVNETVPLYPKLKADNGILQKLPRLLG